MLETIAVILIILWLLVWFPRIQWADSFTSSWSLRSW